MAADSRQRQPARFGVVEKFSLDATEISHAHGAYASGSVAACRTRLISGCRGSGLHGLRIRDLHVIVALMTYLSLAEDVNTVATQPSLRPDPTNAGPLPS